MRKGPRGGGPNVTSDHCRQDIEDDSHAFLMPFSCRSRLVKEDFELEKGFLRGDSTTKGPAGTRKRQWQEMPPSGLD